MKTVLFRVDGGRVWGVSMGHVRRSLILSSQLENEYKIIYLMKDYKDGIEYVRNQGMEVEIIDIDDDSNDRLIKLSEKYSPVKVIFDLKETPYTDFFDYARSKRIQTIVFDIVGSCIGYPDVLINDSFVDEFKKYPHITKNVKLALGPDYFLMERCPEVEPIKESVHNVMITMGGSDPAGLTVKIVSCLLEHDLNYKLNVVLGPTFVEYKELYNTLRSNNLRQIYNNPPDFLGLVGSQDIIITSGGRTLYECAYLGRPVIVVPSIDHEKKTSAEYARLTGSIDIGLWNDKMSPAAIKAALDLYIQNRSSRQSIFEASRGIVDGRAMQRILSLLNIQQPQIPSFLKVTHN
ncbi:MAG: hypothetical protein NTX75_09455 [Proteobacteria bacterium]|nr:hypothetical protein [Pseudomonadota bacterium]